MTTFKKPDDIQKPIFYCNAKFLRGQSFFKNKQQQKTDACGYQRRKAKESKPKKQKTKKTCEKDGLYNTFYEPLSEE